MVEIYLQGVLVAFILSLCKVMCNLHRFTDQSFKAIVLGCLIFSAESWLTVIKILYWELRRLF